MANMRGTNKPNPSRAKRATSAHKSHAAKEQVENQDKRKIELDELVRGQRIVARQARASVEDLLEESAYISVMQAYIDGLEPPCGCLSFINNPTSKLITAQEFLYTLGELRFRLNTGRPIAWDREVKRKLDEWSAKKEELAQLLDNAADLFDSGQEAEDTRVFEAPDGLTVIETVLPMVLKGRTPPPSYEAEFDPDHDPICESVAVGDKSKRKHRVSVPNPIHRAEWPGTENLRRWAEIVRSRPTHQVFPVAWDTTFSGALVDAGSRGAASQNSDGAIRGAVVRAIGGFVPEMPPNSKDGRAAIVRVLSEKIGLSFGTKYPNQLVRGLLRKT